MNSVLGESRKRIEDISGKEKVCLCIVWIIENNFSTCDLYFEFVQLDWLGSQCHPCCWLTIGGTFRIYNVPLSSPIPKPAVTSSFEADDNDYVSDSHKFYDRLLIDRLF